MKKIIMSLLAAAVVLTTTGCSNDGEKDTTTTTTAPEAQQTTVAYQAPETPDTTAEALEYLKGKIPLFVKYLETRRSFPLTYEVETRTADGVSTAGLYIKDKDTIAFTSADYTGASDNTIYDGTNMYYIVHHEKIAYIRNELPIETTTDVVENNLLKLDIWDVSSYKYDKGVKEFEGKTYNYEATIDSNGNASEYYFNQETDALEVVIAGGTPTYVTRIDNTVDDSIFEVPEDYEKGDLDEYLNNLIADKRAAAAEAAATAEAE